MDLVKYFLEEIDKEGVISKKTIEFYRSDLEFFKKFIKNTDIKDISQNDLDEYLQHIKEKYSENSVIRKITSLKSFYKFLVKKDIIQISPMDKISTSRKDVKIREKIEENEIRAILDACPDDFCGNRDKIIIKLLTSTGLKIVDILNIKLSQLKDSDFNYFYINQRGILVMIKIYSALSDEIREFVERYSIQSEYIFENLNNQKFKENFIKYVKIAKLERKIVPSMIKNRYLFEKKEISLKEELNEIELFEKIKQQYLRIGIGDEEI